MLEGPEQNRRDRAARCVAGSDVPSGGAGRRAAERRKDMNDCPAVAIRASAGGVTSSLSWLSTSIVHDLRNPLATIYAGAEMLMHFDPVPLQIKRLATNIYRAADRMHELLAELASEARGSEAEVNDIREIIAAASKAAAAATDNQSVQILLNIPRQMQMSVVRSRIERVFFNLIINSIQAMPTGGTIYVTATKAANCVLIQVEDTGPGIPKRIRDRLFERFVTADKEDGLGLGLALSREAVLDHGGDMWIEPAIGARFIISLPLNRKPRFPGEIASPGSVVRTADSLGDSPSHR
jgi:two-component system sensor histidine kinase HydH